MWELQLFRSSYMSWHQASLRLFVKDPITKTCHGGVWNPVFELCEMWEDRVHLVFQNCWLWIQCKNYARPFQKPELKGHARIISKISYLAMTLIVNSQVVFLYFSYFIATKSVQLALHLEKHGKSIQKEKWSDLGSLCAHVNLSNRIHSFMSCHVMSFIRSFCSIQLKLIFSKPG